MMLAPAAPVSRLTSDVLATITERHGAPIIAALPAGGPNAPNIEAFSALHQQLQGAKFVLFPDIATGHLDRFFHLRLAQVLRRAPPLPVLSIVTLSAADVPRLAGGFADRFRSGWPFAAGMFLAEPDVADRLTSASGLPVGQYFSDALSVRSRASAGQKIALQFQTLWGRSGSTTGFENQVECLVRADFLTIRVFVDLTSRRGATLSARLPRIISENNENAGAHLDVLAVPNGPPVSLRVRDYASYWATHLAATTECHVHDTAIVAAMRRADCVIANHLECVGPALTYAPRARLMLDLRDDRERQAAELMRRNARPEAEIEAARAAAEPAQSAVLAIPDICGHVSASEFERLRHYSQRAALIRPRPYAQPVGMNHQPRYDIFISGDQNPFNITSLRWFIEEVWRPHLAAAGIKTIIAGRAGDHARDLNDGSSLLEFLGFVEDLDAVRSNARLTVIPDRQGTGTAVKTLTALACGHPIVATSVGLRGLDDAVVAMLPAFDEPAAFAGDILALLRDPDRLEERRRLVQQANLALHRGPDHAALLANVPRAR